MRIVVIGSTGHIGTYLIPRLVAHEHDIISVSRGQRNPYRNHGSWDNVKHVVADRDTEENKGSFGKIILDLNPDVVIDLICFRLESARQLAEVLRGRIQHFLHCGTIWVHGPSVSVPTTENERRRPFGEYGEQKAAIEDYLLDQARRFGFPATILHPGHIVGPGWSPLNPAGHFNPEVFGRLARSEMVGIPNLGLETVHHVHADDVAQAFVASLGHRSVAIGESFHAVAPTALSLRGYAESVARWFGKEAVLEFLPWDKWCATVSKDEAAATWDHIAHSPNCSIAKAQRLLGYQPRYTSLEAVEESVQWLIQNGELRI
jgi:nucleoside-diphosphate-sugar epimerase